MSQDDQNNNVEEKQEQDGSKTYKSKEQTLRVEIDRTPEIQKLQDELEKVKSENRELKGESSGSNARYMSPEEIDNLPKNRGQTPLSEIDEKIRLQVQREDLPVSLWEFESKEQMKSELDRAINGEFGKERQDEAKKLMNELLEHTNRVSSLKGEEYELESKPLTQFEFKGYGVPARRRTLDEIQHDHPKMKSAKRVKEKESESNE